MYEEEKKKKSAASVCVTLLHSISSFHDYCQGGEMHLDDSFELNKQHT